jgi:outer membrane beta-barrel protein
MKGFNLKNIILRVLLLSSTALSTPTVMAAEKDLYDFLWLDPDKKVYVLQNKIHKKEHTVYVNLGVGLGLSSTFNDTSLLHGNIGYCFTEEWSVEALYTNYNNKENEALTNLKRIDGKIPFIRNPVNNYGLMAKWSPFYGKINTFNKIFYFDWSFGLGVGKLNTKSNATTVTDTTKADTYNKESYNSIIGKTELTFYASKNIHIGLGLIINNYKAPGPTIVNIPTTDKYRNNLDSVVSIGVSF